MGGIFEALGRRAGWVLALASALALAAAHQIVDLRTGERRLEIDPSLNRLLPSDDPAKQFYDRVRRIFGSDESMVVALVADDVFRRENLEAVVRITRRISQVEGVHHVVSLANALNIRGVGDDLEIAPFISASADEPAAPEVLRREVMNNPIYAGNLVTADGTATALLVYFLDFSDREFVERELDEKIARIAEEERGEAQVWISGLPRVKAVTARILLRDLVRMTPVVLLILGGILALSFRSLHGVVVPLVSIAFALIWTLGLATALGYALNAVTTIVPPLLLTLGLAYSVHVVSENDAQRRENPRGSRLDCAVGALRHVALPVALTGFTTAAGFLSLTLSPLGAIREFGLLSVAGVLLTVLASLTVAPALLILMGPIGSLTSTCVTVGRSSWRRERSRSCRSSARRRSASEPHTRASSLPMHRSAGTSRP
jgi:predicted RND superfamily exporter protein